ncbi:maleylacetate reductase [Amycolatopsis pithecellobii]|uniref:Iron-containing alcohol dehydrogenase n=1 Tax=Amycolatopsis pithecellobii TaxID=664692 RepID=A0A6N7ZB80_9PSEU|nr:maleylacetate reductase [Amycolatopsis pithecellobii]MTD58935.1 iron-containing alcohol dehydrogenase [Amycolatopsis pithecellobii]
MQTFTHSTSPIRVLFGRGRVREASDELGRLGVRRALVLTTPEQRDAGEGLAARIGSLAVGVFPGAAMHTPVTVTAEAMAVMESLGADGVVALGGGSTTGLGKAIAARTGVPQLVIPTTYAGSEVTPILGETDAGVKSTRRGPEILPETVIYDADLTDTLPVSLSCTSGLNAMAHAVEGSYAQDGSPIYTLMAVDALAALREALPVIAKDATDKDARDRALYGAWLCGTVLGGVGMSIHHKLCHTLGGALDLPHAQTHAVLLPHTIAYVEEAVPEVLAPAKTVFGPRTGAALYDFAATLGVPQRLADLGVGEADLDRLAELATANPYWSPRPLEIGGIRALLHRAWAGDRPE